MLLVEAGRKTKVREFDVAILIYQYIVRLDVSAE